MTFCSPAPSDSVGWRLQHSYSGWSELFHVRVTPTFMPILRMVLFHGPLAEALGLNAALLGQPESAAIFAGKVIPTGAKPLA